MDFKQKINQVKTWASKNREQLLAFGVTACVVVFFIAVIIVTVNLKSPMTEDQRDRIYSECVENTKREMEFDKVANSENDSWKQIKMYIVSGFSEDKCQKMVDQYFK